MSVEQLLPRDTIAERLAVVIRERILQFHPGFEPGDRIDIQGLATLFSVSATPVKEALKRLEANGLIEVRARRGVYVNILTRQDVEEIFTVRAGLEQLAFRLCCGQMAPALLEALERCCSACEVHIAAEEWDNYRRQDMAFHRLLIESSGNNRLVALHQVLLEQSQGALVFTPRTVENMRTSLAEHRHLLSVLHQRNLAVIENEIAEHWQHSKARVLNGYAAYLEEVSVDF